jgi:hypothetical protein
MNDKLRTYIENLITETRQDLDRDREKMSKEDIYYDEGYLSALTMLLNEDTISKWRS